MDPGSVRLIATLDITKRSDSLKMMRKGRNLVWHGRGSMEKYNRGGEVITEMGL